jgi:triosephosphate isomerase (TIM)
MYLVGNWKMNGQGAFATELARAVLREAVRMNVLESHTVICCPPALWIRDVVQICAGSGIACGAQDVHTHDSGAFTGNISAAMIKTAGCDYAIVGHSERRKYHAETDELIAQKVAACLRSDIIPILCVGETQAQRDSGEYLDIIAAQLTAVMKKNTELSQKVIISYEPIWAIGTGRVPAAPEIDKVSSFIHTLYQSAGFTDISVLYGGSVNPKNCAEIMSISSVNGVLVGGASLDVEQWTDIMQTATSKIR